MKQEQLREVLKQDGWTEDNWGHYQRRLVSGKKYRIKMQSISIRLEVRNEELKEWIKVDGAYYKDIELKQTERGPRLKFGRAQIITTATI